MPDKYDEIIPTIKSFEKRMKIPSGGKKEHIASNNDIIYVLEGNVTYVINGKIYNLEAGNIAFVSKGSLKYATSDNHNMSLYTCLFTYELYNNDSLPLPFPTVFDSCNDIELLELFTKLDEIWTEKSDTFILKSRAELMMIIAKLLSINSNKSNEFKLTNKHISKIKKYILNNYQQKISLDDLACLVNLHPVYISSLFKEITGYTIKEYINIIRINRAKDLLKSGEFKVAEAAYQCGFEDALYFSKVFKKTTGHSPTEFIYLT